MAASPLLQPPAPTPFDMGEMMRQHMGSGAGPMGWWMGWGPWLWVLLIVLIAAVVALLEVLLRQRPQGSAVSPGPSPAPDTKALLDVVPEAESAVLRPVLESPGISQPEVVHRSGYSKAAVSQALSGLERRGLVYRVREGKVYRVYPGSRTQPPPAPPGPSLPTETGGLNDSEPK